jgi:hypothetical protein
MGKVDKEYVEGQLARRPAWSEIEGVLRDKADLATVERLNLHKVRGLRNDDNILVSAQTHVEFKRNCMKCPTSLSG